MQPCRPILFMAVALSVATPACNSGGGISANVQTPTPTMSPTMGVTPTGTGPDGTPTVTNTSSTGSETAFTPTATVVPTPSPTPWPADSVIYVPTDFESIQQAIDVADSGMEIRIEAGTYTEDVDFKGKTLSIVSLEGPNKTVIEGTGAGATVKIASGEATGTRLSGFTIKGGTGFLDNGGYRVGGGLYIINSTPKVENCIITGNTAQYGGGMAIENGEAIIDNVQIYNNEGSEFGGALSTRSARVEITGLIAWDNYSTQGGGAHLNDTLGYVSNSLFSNNTASDLGGAVSLRYCGPDLELSNNVLIENEAPDGAAVYFYASDTSVTANIIAYSEVGAAMEADSDSYEPAITYNDFFENQGGISAGALRNPMLQEGNIDDDPKFLGYSVDGDPINDNLFLTDSSACIDAGPSEPSYNDVDGSRNDIGIYGGPNANDAAFSDLDADGMPDLWEDLNGLDPAVNDADDDLDNDGLSNIDEYEEGTIANDPDTDNDGVMDGEEVANGTDPGDAIDNRPVAVISGGGFAEAGEQVRLDGSDSYDPNGDALTYQWTLVSVPDESSVNDNDIQSDGETAVLFTPDVDGLYVFELVVNDGRVDSEAAIANVTTAGTLYVPSDNIKNIQTAINRSNDGDRILVSAGVYREILSFDGKRVRVESIDGPEATIIDADGETGPVVTFKNNLIGYDPDFPAQLVGFTVTGGVGDIREVERVGGGIFVTTAAPLVENCIIVDNGAPEEARNIAQKGGGIYVFGGGLTLRNSKVIDNYAEEDGGGLYAENPAIGLVLENNIFEDNEAEEGGGLYIRDDVSGLIRNNIIRKNEGLRDVGGLQITGTLSDFVFSNNLIIENEGKEVGGVYFTGSGSFIANTIVHNQGFGVWLPVTGAGEVTFSYNDSWANELANYGGEAAVQANQNGNISVDPEFALFDEDLDTSESLFYLIPSSKLVDAGPSDTEMRDPDGSRNDIGAFGGPKANMSGLLDEDYDGMADYWEEIYGLDVQVNDANEDSDSDGLSNSDEYQYGCNPTVSDSDFDGVSDGDEVLAGTDPTSSGDNQPVAVVAESYIGVGLGELVILDGSASTDPQGDPLMYTWSIVSVPEGSAISEADITGLNEAIASYSPDVEGEYSLELMVSDGFAQSLPVSVTVYASETLEVGEGGYSSIQAAIDAAKENDRVLVQPGTYVEDIDFSGKLVVLESIEGPLRTIIQGTSLGSTVTFVSGESAGSILRGFTITGGTGTFVEGTAATEADPGEPDLWYGGGIFISDSSPTLDDLIITQNFADIGGGIAVRGGAPTIQDCYLAENEAGEVAGGGMALVDSQAEVSATEIFDNAGRTAGGIWVDGGAPNLHNLLVQENRSTSNQGTGGIQLTACEAELLLVNTTVVGNSGRVASSLSTNACLGRIANNIFAFGTTGPGVLLNADGQPVYEYNDSYGHVAGDFSETGVPNPIGQDGNFSEDPAFVYFSAGDDQIDSLQLADGSPCIDAGDIDAAFNDPDGSRNDLGAYGGPGTNEWD